MDVPGAKIYRHSSPFILESGEVLPSLEVAYHTYGRLNEIKDNCIWVCHGLTANSDVADWWPHTVEKGAFLDPDKYFIVCANILCSCYGSTGPASVNPSTGAPWYDTFPKVTIRDCMEAHRLLMHHLGISRLFSIIGASVGGFEALEWASAHPGDIHSLVLIATEEKASPWAVALDETQRMTIFSDATYGEPHLAAGARGLAAARAIGLLSYRGPHGYNASQKNHDDFNPASDVPHRAQTYQRYQGEKLVKRFDAYSYVSILNMFDTHDIGRGRGGIEKTLASLMMPTIVVGISTDIIFTVDHLRKIAATIPGATYREIDSPFGHDGFLVEYSQLNEIIKEFFEKVQ